MLCLVWLPHSYNGRGPAESCVRVIAEFPACGIETHLYVSRLRKPVSPELRVFESAGPLLRYLPWRLARPLAQWFLRRRFRAAIDRAPPGSLAYFWPNVPEELVRRARARGLVTVREMINSPTATAKPILDAAYRKAGFAPQHTITDEVAARETAELQLHDHVFASNPEVERALKHLGIPAERILPTTFGWVAARFGGENAAPEPGRPFRACYVGTLNVRKGVPELLAAWREAGLDGELWLAGQVDPMLQPLVDEALASDPRIRHFGHVTDVATFYRQCDAFVFPTHEEGGPQVTYEAASCGLAVVTTPMGAARLVDHGRTGLVVEPGSVSAIVAALRQLAGDGEMCRSMGEAAARAAPDYEYGAVGRQRAGLLKAIRV